MTARNEKLDRLAILSPCSESWQAMGGDERARFCWQCQKHVYDLAALEAREVEALIQATQGHFCARITRDRSGRIVTREPEIPQLHLQAVTSVRRASPVVAAVVTAVVGLTGAGWAEAPPSAPVAAVPTAPDPAHPAGPGGVVLGGRAVDDQGFPLPGTTVLLRHPEEGWRFVTVTDAQGWFQFHDLPSGVYDLEAELEGFDFEAPTRLALGPEGRQITFMGVASKADTITVLTGETGMVVLPLDIVFRQSHVVVAATVGPSVTLQEPGAGSVVRRVRTELRITSVLKGKPRGETIQIDHYVTLSPPKDFRPGNTVLALLDPFGPGDGRPDSLVYISSDPVHAFHPLPADPRLRPELGIDGEGWQAMSYLADAMDHRELQALVARAITQVEAERRQLAGSRDAAGEKRLRARIAAVEEELRQRFVQALDGGG